MAHELELCGYSVYLSHVNEDDYQLFYEWYNDPETSRLIGTFGTVYSLETEKQYVQRLSKDRNEFMIIEDITKAPIGFSTFFDMDRWNDTAEMGILIGNRNARNKGYGKETVALMLKYGFDELELNNIMIRTYEYNKRAINLYTKNNFTEFGRRIMALKMEGNYYDEVYMQITRNNYYRELT